MDTNVSRRIILNYSGYRWSRCGLNKRIERIVHDLGYTIKAAPMDFQGGKIKIHRVVKVETGTGEALMLDMLLVTPEIQEAWNNRLEVEWEGGPLQVVSPEGLILLKSFRKSGQEQDDINFLRRIIDED